MPATAEERLGIMEQACALLQQALSAHFMATRSGYGEDYALQLMAQRKLSEAQSCMRRLR